MPAKESLIPIERIERTILLIRNQRVIMDADIAELYGVSTKRLNEQVKRNIDRFPEDFMFQLTQDEYDDLRSQFATSSSWGGRRYPPYVFTEHGAVMPANVLKSEVAINVSIQVVRAFVRLRGMLAAHEELSRKLDEMERKYNARFKVVFDAIRKLMVIPESKQRKIGFKKD